MSYRELKDLHGFMYKEWKNELGQFHREDGPAYICYYPDGSIYCEGFYLYGDHHREGGPAYIQYNPDGSIKIEAFYIDGELLGRNKEGFWALWEILSEEGRRAPNLLKYLAGFVNYSCSSYVEIKK